MESDFYIGYYDAIRAAAHLPTTEHWLDSYTAEYQRGLACGKQDADALREGGMSAFTKLAEIYRSK